MEYYYSCTPGLHYRSKGSVTFKRSEVLEKYITNTCFTDLAHQMNQFSWYDYFNN